MSKEDSLSISRVGSAQPAHEAVHASEGQARPKWRGLSRVWPTRRDWRLGLRDLLTGIQYWDLWALLGVSDIRQRYKRSRFGQFWITLSMGVFIGGIGLVYSTLFHQPVHEYLPYLATNITVWTLISGVIGDSSNVFTQAAPYLRQDAIQKTIFVMRALVRNLVIFAHNLVIIPLAFLIFGYAPSPWVLAALPGLALVTVALFLITLLLGVLSTRFRDLAQIIQNALQLLFFVTPVMWRADQVSGPQTLILELNPFASMLDIVAQPILGHAPRAAAYVASICFVLVLAALALPLFARFRARLVYWL